MKKSLHLIHGYGTAAIYGEQMRAIIDQRYVLQQLRNEAEAGMFDLPNDCAVVLPLRRLDVQLSWIINEWRKEFPALTARSVAASETGAYIEKLPRLSRVRQHRYAALHKPFEAAASPFRDALAVMRTSPRTSAPTRG